VGLRTYLPTLALIAKAVCSYIDRNEAKIKEFIGEGNANKVDAANTACSILVAAIDAVLPDPS